VTTNLTTNPTAREIAQQLKFRACLAHAVLFKARGKVKDQIRARGDKIAHYSAREITELANQYLAQPGHREILTQLVLPSVHERVFKTKR